MDEYGLIQSFTGECKRKRAIRTFLLGSFQKDISTYELISYSIAAGRQFLGETEASLQNAFIDLWNPDDRAHRYRRLYRMALDGGKERRGADLLLQLSMRALFWDKRFLALSAAAICARHHVVFL